QNTQNRDTMALQVKVSELILAVHGAKNRLAAAEDLTEEELEELHKDYCRRADSARETLEHRRAARKPKEATHHQARRAISGRPPRSRGWSRPRPSRPSPPAARWRPAADSRGRRLAPQKVRRRTPPPPRTRPQLCECASVGRHRPGNGSWGVSVPKGRPSPKNQRRLDDDGSNPAPLPAGLSGR